MSTKQITLIVQTDNQELKALYRDLVPAYNNSAGIDLFIPEQTTFNPGVTILDHQIRIQIVDSDRVLGNIQDLHFLIVPRSSLYKHGLLLMNSIGVIDKDYRGTIKGIFFNPSDKEIVVDKHARLLQVICPLIFQVDNYVVKEHLTKTLRSENGLGSTGE